MMRAGRLLIALIALGVALADEAQARSIQIEHMDVELTVDRDGAVSARETLRVRFEGKWNGIFRTLPEAPDGVTERTVSLLSATDGDGRLLDTWIDTAPDRLRWKIRVPGAENATRVVRLTYRVEDVVPGGARALHWNAVGTDWTMPIQAVRVRVRAPGGFVLADTTAFTGTPGSQRRDATIRIVPEGLFFETTRALQPGEGLTIRTVLAEAAPVGVLQQWGRMLRAQPLLWISLLPLLL